MGIRVLLNHKTVYNYDRLVTLSPQIVRLRPAPHSRTPVTSYSLRIEPEEHFINWQQDPFGNFLARLVFLEQTRHFSLEVSLAADVTVINPFDFFLEDYAEKYPFRYTPLEESELRPFLECSPNGPQLQKLLASIDRHEIRMADFLVHLNQHLQRQITYVIRMEPGIQTPEETLELRSGSCRDTAWLLVQVLRNLGLAARFVSGYLIQLKPDVKPLEGPPGPNDDFTDLHAWAEVYLPGAGWIGLDPTSGLLTGEGHIPLAASAEPRSAAPVSGLVSECEVEFFHEMRVTRIHEDPRVTKPYTEEQWRRLCKVGDEVDAELAAGDVRLTMGGEPTFVSIDDMDGEEWNTAALGPDKLRLAGSLVKRLQRDFAPGGFLHWGQGKWYPGESLPRWAFSCYWRTDGLPLWRNPQLIADIDCDYGFGTAEAQRFAEELTRTLSIDPDYLISAYEDPLAYLLTERQLPINVDPEDNKLDDPEERERLRRVFERGLGTPVGFVLPLQRAPGKSGPAWQTGLWMLRARHLFLIPGDSPVGFRLPLKSLPWQPAEQIPQRWEVDPMAPAGPLPVPALRQRKLETTAAPLNAPVNGPGASVVRTALSIEARGGRLWAFLPPVNSIEDYLELITALEETAALLKMPILVEGYPPPYDSRVRVFRITPDPGVIEVNIHPASN
jgi:transglutaminase-like putative cysteine protease